MELVKQIPFASIGQQACCGMLEGTLYGSYGVAAGLVIAGAITIIEQSNKELSLVFKEPVCHVTVRQPYFVIYILAGAVLLCGLFRAIMTIAQEILAKVKRS